jgi:erythromycin esterase-like protein
MMHDAAVIEAIRRHAISVNLESAAQRLLDAIDPHISLVLIGEATHGTPEFYRIRADLTRALIRQRGLNLVAAEADWPDAYRANQWVRLLGDARATSMADIGELNLEQLVRERFGAGCCSIGTGV